jgi:hypothetical protein
MPRGDDLAQLVRNVATAERRVMGAAARATRDALRESVDAGFAQGHDVHGKSYPAPKDGHSPPMVRSGRLRAAYRYRIGEGTGAWTVTIAEATDYGQYLRDGTWKMDARQHLPRPEQPLPAAWLALMQQRVDAAVVRVMS